MIQNSNGTSEFYYAYTDYQGSLTALTYENGTVAERYAYDPWGRRRNPDDWKNFDTRTSLIVNRGYTMHEHLDKFGVINMNGRVYDPITTSFFSPDPYIQAPDNWLNYNRYSYCLNNPFKYTDPSGEFFYIDLGIGWSYYGGFSVSVGVGVGIKNYLSAGVSIGYNFGNNSFNAGVNASYSGLYISAGYNTSSGWNVGTGYSVGIPIGYFSISVFSAGVSYSQVGGFSANLGLTNYNQYSGWSIDPSFGVSTTARWGKSVSDFADAIGVAPKDEAEISTQKQLSDLMNAQNIEPTNYYADYPLIEGELSGNLQKDYIRDVDGIIWKKQSDGTYKKIGGVTLSYTNGFKSKSFIYLSTHNTVENLLYSMYHEFIHSWQYVKFGHTDLVEWDKFKEASAYRYSVKYHPHLSVPSYSGKWSYMLNRWPNLPAVNYIFP